MIIRKPGTSFIVNLLLAISVSIFSTVYNIGAGTAILLDIQPTPINFSIKMLGFSINMFLILLFVVNKKIFLNKRILPLMAFWIIYSLRLIIDTQILGLASNFQNLQILSYALGGSFSTIVAITLYRKYFNPVFFLKIFYFFSFLANIIISILLLFRPNSTLLLYGRLSFGLNDNDNQDIINAISISVNGGLIVLISLAFIFHKKSFAEFKKYKFFIYSSALLGFLNLFLGGSRGPLIAIALLSLLIFLQKKIIIESLSLGKAFKLFIGAGSLLLLIFILFFSLSREIFVLRRIFNDGQFVLFEDSNRVQLYNSAWNQFLSSPLIGDRYYEVITKTYPHNLILESLMATGLVGTFFLMLTLVLLLLIFFSNRKRFSHSSVILYLCFYWLMCDFVSGSIWGNTDFWIFSALAICVSYNFPKKLSG